MIKISIHRKYTKNFQSYGYRIGLEMDVNKVDDARSGYYEGKAFLNERIAEEDLIIKNIMDKKGAEKNSGYKVLDVIPEKKMISGRLISLGGSKDPLFEKEEGNIKRIVGETGLKRSDVIDLAKEKMVELKGLIGEEGAIYIVGKELGVNVSGSAKEGDGNIMIPYDVRQVKRTSAKAVLVELFGGKGDVWIPKSCIGDGDAMDLMQTGVKIMLFVKNWFLEKSGLI